MLDDNNLMFIVRREAGKKCDLCEGDVVEKIGLGYDESTGPIKYGPEGLKQLCRAVKVVCYCVSCGKIHPAKTQIGEKIDIKDEDIPDYEF